MKAADPFLGEAIDRLVNVEMRFASGLPRGIVHRLYDAARAHHGAPLSTLAADALLGRLTRADRVMIVTGAGAAPWLPYGETDGPLGAAALARTLDLLIGAKPVVVSEERNLGPIAASLEAAGLAILPQELFDIRSAGARLEAMDLGEQAGPESADRLYELYRPKAIVFVEKGGPNVAGVFHTITGSGRDRTVMASADRLAERARQDGVLTVGIGDGGNEIGFGAVRDAVADIQTFGRSCACPCGRGIATVVETDFLVVAAISNWGAYGLCAAMACATGRPEGLHDTRVEQRMLERCVDAGAVDGILARQILAVDGTNEASQQAIVTLLGNLVANALSHQTRPF